MTGFLTVHNFARASPAKFKDNERPYHCVRRKNTKAEVSRSKRFLSFYEHCIQRLHKSVSGRILDVGVFTIYLKKI